MHPLDDVTRGERLIKKVYEAIRLAHWERSLLIIAFDENGGFYDHVAPPPATPPGDLINESYVKNHFRFNQLGPACQLSLFRPIFRRRDRPYSI